MLISLRKESDYFFNFKSRSLKQYNFPYLVGWSGFRLKPDLAKEIAAYFKSGPKIDIQLLSSRFSLKR